MQYFNQPLPQILAALKSAETGLSPANAAQRLAQDGPNALEEKQKTPAWVLFLRQFKDFMILILAAAAVLSGIMGDLTDTIIILIIILLNAIVGFVQEFRAEKAMEALKKMAITSAQVLRGGQTLVLPAVDLVVGDVVLLEAGNAVPADLRLMDAHALRIDESSLTGESVPADKKSGVLEGKEPPLGDQWNMAFKGTLITNGRAKGVVVATGMRTELGKIASMLQEQEQPTPLQQRMTKFGKKLSYIILLICLVLLLTGILRGEDPFRLLLLSISLAVAAIPEALPALITIALSQGAARLARKKALVRQLPAVETLGSVTFICSDKTGTLTQNKMRVVRTYDHMPHSANPILPLGMALNHDVKIGADQSTIGEPTELALVEKHIEDRGIELFLALQEQFPRVAELPFDSDRKCMTTVHRYPGGYLALTKGASEAVAGALLDPSEAQHERAEAWAREGIRVLAFAYRELAELPEPFRYETLERDMRFAGLVGLMDPAREEVKRAIHECKTAGIRPVMITGDHPATAKAIAREIGILEEGGLTLTGAELKQLDDARFLEQVERTAVYARVSPEQKLRIVRALQQKGHFAAMTGDGVNDAPSLKAANIGVAMGINGTDVSKESAELILLDDNFATIVKAVKEGRRIFDNIRKFVKYIMTCNGAEIWTIFLAPLLGMPIPLLPIHILWINLVTDGLPALALAGEKAERDVMKRPPRATNESLFADGLGYHVVWVGLLMAGVTLGTQAWALNQQLEHWQTMVFTVLSLSQLGHVMGIRSERMYLFQQGILSNKPLLASVLLTFGLQMMVVYLPFFNAAFKTQPLSLQELGICIAMSLVVFHAVELEKWVRKRWRSKV
jgi:Ca2+-transporting ATPase